MSLIGKSVKIGSKGVGASAVIVGKGAGGVASARSLGDDIRSMSSNGSGMFASMKQSVSDRFASSPGNFNMPMLPMPSSLPRKSTDPRAKPENETLNKKQKERRNEESDASDEDEEDNDK